MTDIRLIRKQLQVEFGNLNSADYDSADLAASDFYDFLYGTEAIKEIIAGFPENTINIEEWVESLYNTPVPLPRDKQERMAFLLAVLEKYKDDLYSIAHHFNVNSRKIIDHIRKYVDTMVRPLYQYLDNELHKKELEVQPVSSIAITNNGNAIIVNGDNIGTISQTNNDTVRQLSELSDLLQKSAELTDEQKLEAINNIDTIKSQVVSPKPNGQIIKLAWDTVSAMATVAGATDFITKVAPLLANLIG